MALIRLTTRSARTIAARRWVLLGMASVLAFDKFVLLYRKYSEDQPRGPDGRWIDAGGGDGPETTGSLVRTFDEKTGNPLIDSVTDKLHGIASDVHDLLGDGAGAGYGTVFHHEFAQRVRRSGIPDLTAEVSFNDKMEVPYASPDSVRTDVVLRNYKDGVPSVTAIWDLKTGNATLTASRAREIRQKAGATEDTPLIELQINLGIRNKEMGDVLVLRS